MRVPGFFSMWLTDVFCYPQTSCCVHCRGVSLTPRLLCMKVMKATNQGHSVPDPGFPRWKHQSQRLGRQPIIFAIIATKALLSQLGRCTLLHKHALVPVEYLNDKGIVLLNRATKIM